MPTKRTARPVAEPKTCEAPDCDVEFIPKRSTARFHSGTCRQRAARAARAAAANETDEAKTGTDAEHGLVKAVRAELEQVGKAGTFNGQLALQLARRLANPEESGSTALSKELRAVMAEALAQQAPAESEAPARGGRAAAVGDDDEVTKARRAREQARQAAGLAGR